MACPGAWGKMSEKPDGSRTFFRVRGKRGARQEPPGGKKGVLEGKRGGWGLVWRVKGAGEGSKKCQVMMIFGGVR
jgi:hypothetical protein